MGRVTARLMAREGAAVVGCDLNPEGAAETARLVDAEGGAIDSSAPVDLGDRSDVEAWVEGAVARHGRIDVLYNNASMPRFAPFAEQSDEDYLFTIDNELHLVWRACQVAWPHLAEVGGAIVNIGSGAGLAGVRTLPQAAHAAAKGAVLALTRQLAAEGIAVGIRVNSVSPGRHGDAPDRRACTTRWATTHPSRRSSSARSPERRAIRWRSRRPACTSRPTRRHG